MSDACQVSRLIPDLDQPVPSAQCPVPSAEDQAALNKCQGMTEMSRQPQTCEKSGTIDTTRREKTNRLRAAARAIEQNNRVTGRNGQTTSAGHDLLLHRGSPIPLILFGMLAHRDEGSMAGVERGRRAIHIRARGNATTIGSEPPVDSNRSTTSI